MIRSFLRVGSVLVLMLFLAVAASSEVIIDGVYDEVGDSSSFMIFAQDGDVIHAMGYWVSNGSPCVWFGEGKRSGNTFSYSFRYSIGKSYSGTHTWTISSDGRTLTGTWKTSDGRSGSASLKKRPV